MWSRIRHIRGLLQERNVNCNICNLFLDTDLWQLWRRAELTKFLCICRFKILHALLILSVACSSDCCEKWEAAWRNSILLRLLRQQNSPNFKMCTVYRKIAPTEMARPHVHTNTVVAIVIAIVACCGFKFKWFERKQMSSPCRASSLVRWRNVWLPLWGSLI